VSFIGDAMIYFWVQEVLGIDGLPICYVGIPAFIYFQQDS
jgi:hypothetical protein